jgi:hypothetical protein
MGMEIGIEENKESQDNNILGSPVIFKSKNNLSTSDKKNQNLSNSNIGSNLQNSNIEPFNDKGFTQEINQTNLSTNKLDDSHNIMQDVEMAQTQVLPTSNIQQDPNLRASNDLNNPELGQDIKQSTAIEGQNEMQNFPNNQQMSNSESQISNFNNMPKQDLKQQQSQFVESQGIYDKSDEKSNVKQSQLIESHGIYDKSNEKSDIKQSQFIESQAIYNSMQKQNNENPENPENQENHENPENPENHENLENQENHENQESQKNQENVENPEGQRMSQNLDAQLQNNSQHFHSLNALPELKSQIEVPQNQNMNEENKENSGINENDIRETENQFDRLKISKTKYLSDEEIQNMKINNDIENNENENEKVDDNNENNNEKNIDENNNPEEVKPVESIIPGTTVNQTENIYSSNYVNNPLEAGNNEGNEENKMVTSNILGSNEFIKLSKTQYVKDDNNNENVNNNEIISEPKLKKHTVKILKIEDVEDPQMCPDFVSNILKKLFG